MKDELTVEDFKLFVKDNLKLILTTSMLMAIAGILLVWMNYRASTPQDSATDVESEMFEGLSRERFEELEELPFDLISDDDVELIQAYQTNTAFGFMIFVTNEAGEPVGNLSMMRALFRHDNVVERASEIIGEPVTPDPILSVNIQSYGDEGLFGLQFGRADRELSEELAQAYYQIVQEEEIFALNQLNVSIYEDSPIPVQSITDEDDESSDAPAVTHSPRALIRNATIYGIGLFIVGLVVGLITALLKLLLSKKVSSLYDYVREDTDKIVRLSHLRHVSNEDRIAKAVKNLAYPRKERKLVLHEDHFTKDLLTLLQSGVYEISGDIDKLIFETDFSHVKQEIDQVIILTKTNETEKDWYNNQRVQLKGYNYPVKVIQF